MIAREVTDLPEPDSPTSPSTPPRPIENETSRTAGALESGRSRNWN